MMRLKDTHYHTTADFLESAVRIAEYYGFVPLDEIKHIERSRQVPANVYKEIERQISFARRDERMLPVVAKRALICERPAHGTLLAWRIANTTTGIPCTSFELHIIGTSSTIAEAVLIEIAHAIAEEAGIAERTLSINNIGTPESSGRYVREVGSYLRKHIDSISPTLRERIATDPLGTLVQLIERGHPITPRAPTSMEYLSEEERRRFWEMLEHLEGLGIPYELDGQILGSRECWSHTLFELSTTDAESGSVVPIAFGGRYDPLASRFARSPLGAAMVSISCETHGRRTMKHRPMGLPLVYFAYISPEARRKSLQILDMLRRAGIPVHHGIWYDRIAEQMLAAQSIATPYVLILGHKEVVDGTVMVREVATNSQDAIPVDELTSYLKRRRAIPTTAPVMA